MLIVLIHWLWI